MAQPGPFDVVVRSVAGEERENMRVGVAGCEDPRRRLGQTRDSSHRAKWWDEYFAL